MDQSTSEHYKNIKGWAIDADPRSRPYFPIHKMQANTGAHWITPEKQAVDMEILKSSELPRLTAVFGTSIAPKGLSGIIRRFAFRYSESEYLHWIPLLLADRINVVEGLISDLLHGHIPNIFSEMGMGADWKYDRQNYYKRATKTVAAVVVPALIVYFLFRDKDKHLHGKGH